MICIIFISPCRPHFVSYGVSKGPLTPRYKNGGREAQFATVGEGNLQDVPSSGNVD